jgi:tRNA modification GTPase
MSDMATIYALSSGVPPAGIAVIRLSGAGVRFGLQTLIDSVPEPRRAVLRTIRNTEGKPIDEGIVIFFPGPGSFTGEDVAEFHVHGGRAVVTALLDALAAVPNSRPAEPGEFTRRAFLNRRLDLSQVEGLADLVQAETEAQRRQALEQANGALARQLEDWRSRLVRARALVEAEFDFGEEEIGEPVSARAWPEVDRLVGEISSSVADGRRGERIREGATIVLLGPPNAGKSSLLNALARRDVAIVTPEPGTTRDLIEGHLDLEGHAVTIIDTAGLREAESAAEREGTVRALRRAETADLVLLLQDVTEVRLPYHSSRPPAWRIGTKVDLIDSEAERTSLSGSFDQLVSVKTGEGVESLLTALSTFVANEGFGETSLITRARHRTALLAALDALRRSQDSTQALELRSEDLRAATDALGRISGRVDAEDLLDVIFREFCIGK